MRNKLGKVQYLLFALLLFALTGCGASNLGGTAATAGNGSIAAKLQWGADGKTTAKSVASIPVGVAKMRLTVTGKGLPVVRNEIAVTGTTATGQVDGVYPGTVSLVVQALDASGTTLYEGFALNVVVAAGATSDVGTINMTVPTVKTADAACLGCHETTIGVTGQNIIAEFKQSGHYTNLSFTDPTNKFGVNVGTGCNGCHGPNHDIQDPSAGGTSARCFDCHSANNAILVANHDTWYLANGTACSACHQVHNTSAANMERKTWAQSAHGATDFANLSGGALFNNCANRCHNAQGFITAVNNPTALVQGNITAQSQQMITCNACHSDAARGILRTLAGTKAGSFATYTTSSKGYQFAPNQAAFNPNKKAYYPDVAGSNLCVVCHSGTTEGTATSLGLSDPYFVNSATAIAIKKGGTITQHNMPAAAVMYVKFGFMNLSTGTNGTTQAYLNSLTSDLDAAPGATGTISSTHRKFGTSQIAADSHFSASNPAPSNFLTNGPCAVCHVSGSHTFKIDQAAISAVCNKCHSSENGNTITTIDAFKQFFLEPQQEVYRNAILLGATIVNSKVAAYNATLTATPNALGYSTANPLQFNVGIDPMTSAQAGKVVLYKSLKDPANPYATDGTLSVNSLATAATTSPYYSIDYTNAAIALGYSTVAGDAGYTKFIGAISNIAFFAKDNGGFAHARTYSRRLIYDSLDFLNDGILNRNVSTTAISLSNTIGSAVAGLYTKGTNAYNSTGTAITTPYSGTSESMLYLIGWNRTSGVWNSPERP
jgi:hypothetical protein